MIFQPETVVRLLSNVPLSLNETNQLWFDSLTAQTSYFSGKVAHTFTEFTYQRKEGNFIAVDINAELLYNCNYLMFQNSNYGSKWFYAYITDIEYKAPSTTWVHYQIDPFQTWLTSLQFKQSFVEREHVSRWNVDGTPTINTIEEGINYGTEYRTVWQQNYYPYSDCMFMLLCCKNNIGATKGSAEFSMSSIMSGVPTPLNYFVLPFNGSYQLLNVNGQRISFLGAIFNAISSNEDLVGNAVSLSVIPYLPFDVSVSGNNVTSSKLHVWEANGIKVARISDNEAIQKTLASINKYANFPSYSESKLLMYPYSYTELTDFQGNVFVIKNEYVNGNTINIEAMGGVNALQKTAYKVKNYLGSGSTLDNAIINQTVSEIPILDDYTAAYLQGNKNSLITGTLSSLASTALSGGVAYATGNPVALGGAVLSGIQGIAGTMAKLKDIENVAPSISSQGNNCVFDYGNDIKGFWLRKKTITSEYANSLQDYFKMFGYKVNRVKVPNLHTRQSWNYIKMIDCTITGNIPQDDLNTIKGMFNNGITLWHNTDVGNYALSNNEI